jgi:putative NADH-flavin reductase
MKNILLLGASGRTGKLVLEYALKNNYNVTALVRDKTSISTQSSQLTVIEGTPYNVEDLKRSIAHCDVVISTLNNPRKTDMPWSKPIGAPDIIERSINNTIAAMKEKNMKRIVTLSSFGVGDSIRLMGGLGKFFMKYTNMRVVMNDHNRAEASLFKSNLNYTSVRAATLNDKTDDKALTVDYIAKPAMYISRKNVAKFMVDVIDDLDYYKKAPLISEK